jgi:hypothetical protein
MVHAWPTARYDRAMASLWRWLPVLLCLVLGAAPPRSTAAPASVVATPAPPHVVAELSSALERTRARFEARDLAGVMASVSEQYRSSGITKAGLRDQLAAMFTLYQQLRARVTVDRVEMVDGSAWIYTTGEVSGRVPVMGWVSVLAWEAEPEVARPEPGGWRLFGFQD